MSVLRIGKRTPEQQPECVWELPRELAVAKDQKPFHRQQTLANEPNSSEFREKALVSPVTHLSGSPGLSQSAIGNPDLITGSGQSFLQVAFWSTR